jgi:hypothetical protein
MTKHQYFNPKSKKHQRFADKVKQNLDKEDWIKTPDLITAITGGKEKGWNEWSSEWTRNVLYSMNNPEVKPDWVETEKREGPGNKHLYWRLKE